MDHDDDDDDGDDGDDDCVVDDGGAGDYADDAVVWIHPNNTDSSFLIGLDNNKDISF